MTKPDGFLYGGFVLQEFLYIISGTVNLLIDCTQLLLLLRMVMLFLPFDEDGAFGSFVFGVTEPLIYPARCVLERFEFFASSPIDFSATVTYFALTILGIFL